MLDDVIEVFGRQSAINLLRELMARPEQGGKVRSRRHPVLVFEGARGSGKTALVTALAAMLEQHVPYSHIDFEANQHATVPEVLSALAFELGRRCPRYGVLRFPRFAIGRLIMRQNIDLSSHARACQQVREALEKERNLDRLQQIMQETAGDVLGVVQQQTGVPLGALGKHVPGLALDRLTRWAPSRRIVLGSFHDWYGHRGRGRTNDAIHVLVDLNRWALNSEDEDACQRIDQLLWDAFLTDLRDEFRRHRRADELSLNCVILLDNVDTALGQLFINGLVQARRQCAAEGRDDPDPMTAVVTSRGTLLADIPVADQVYFSAEAAGSRISDRHENGTPHWWGRYRLTDLTQDETGSMVSALALREGNLRRLSLMIHQLTGGHPASTRLLSDALVEHPGDLDELARLLDQPEPVTGSGRPTIAESRLTTGARMLERLLGDFPEEAFDDLMTCAAARERSHALRLATHSSLLALSQANYVSIIEPVLWPTTEGAGPILLRRLLLRRLVQRKSTSPTSWSTVFDWHRTHCAGAGDETGELYYGLASGDLPRVAQRLHERLLRDKAVSWLALLTSVVVAPRRPHNHNDNRDDNGRPGHDNGNDNRDNPIPGPMDEVRALLREVPESYLPLAQLIACLLIVNDPFTGSRRRSLHLHIAADYTELAKLSPDGTELLLQAAFHRRQAEQWK